LYITTGIFRLWCFDKNSPIHSEDCIVFIDECQRTMQEPMTRQLVAYLRILGKRLFFISATMDPSSVADKLGAKVYAAEDETERHEVEKQILKSTDAAEYLSRNAANLPNTLFLCSTRGEVTSLANTARELRPEKSIITIMGGDNVEEKQTQLKKAAGTESGYFAFGTFGVANESVTYPILTRW